MTSAVEKALATACQMVGLDAGDMRLIRHHANAVFYLPHESAVARVSTIDRLDSAHLGLAATRWLRSKGFPATEPLSMTQPVETGQHLTTFWRYYDQGGSSPPSTAELAPLIRQLHAFDAPPFPLPAYEPLQSFQHWLAEYGKPVLDDQEYEFLHSQATELLAKYDELDSVLGHGLIHGDTRTGNLLWHDDGVMLCDWDSVGFGPRELDLIITYQGVRYGRSEAKLDEFSNLYGWDIRQWPGCRVLQDIRDLHTLSAPLRLAHERPAMADELHYRLGGLMAGHRTQQWHSL